MMKKIALLASISAAFVAAGATVYEVNVPTGNLQTNFTAAQKTAIAALGADDEVQKTGGGRLVVISTTDIASFKGTIRISDGVYEAASTGNNISGVFGKADGPTIVESGATLAFSAWISAKNGDNVVNRSEHMPWYTGSPLLEFLETVPVNKSASNVETDVQRAFRFPVQYVIRPISSRFPDFRGYAGRVASGIIRVGDRIKVLSSGLESGG